MKKRIIFKFIKRSFVVLLCAVLLFIVGISKFSNKVNAFPVAAAPVIAGVVAFLGAAGVSITANGSTNGQGFGDAIESMAKDFVFDNKTLSDFYNDDNAVNYIIGQNGAKKVAVYSTVFSNWLTEFADYVTDTYSLDFNSYNPVFSQQLFKTQSGNYLLYSYNDILYNSGVTIQSSIPTEVDSLTTIQVNDNFYFTIRQYVQSRYMGIQIIGYDGSGNVLFNNSLRGNETAANTKIVFAKYSNDIRVYLYYWNRGDQFINIPASYITGAAFENITVEGALNDGYDDFEQALTDAQTQAGTGENARIGVGVTDVPLNPPYTKENIADGILNYAADVPLEGGLVGGYEDDKAAEEENDGSIAPTGEMVGSNIVLVDGLEDFFPFCIPFDLIALVQKFDVPPEAPVIHWNMSFANRFSDEEIVLDFSGWETAAMIFRICVVIGFCIFLILKTRDMIRG